MRMTARVNWDTYFSKIATMVATRATCDRKHVGAVIVRHRNILATGYNGSIRGEEHCDDVGHMMEEGHCVRTVHAEQNALCAAAAAGTVLEGATCYCTALPCWLCFKMLCNTGVVRIVYGEAYRASDHLEKVQQVCFRKKIELVHLIS